MPVIKTCQHTGCTATFAAYHHTWKYCEPHREQKFYNARRYAKDKPNRVDISDTPRPCQHAGCAAEYKHKNPQVKYCEEHRQQKYHYRRMMAKHGYKPRPAREEASIYREAAAALAELQQCEREPHEAAERKPDRRFFRQSLSECWAPDPSAIVRECCLVGKAQARVQRDHGHNAGCD